MTRLIALLLTVLTGFTGLVYEVTWQKYLATLLGSHGEATAAVLAIFLGGLSVGYAWFGRVTHRRVARARQTHSGARLLLLYAAIEAGIGVYVLLFPWLFSGARALSLILPDMGAGAGFAVDVLLCALLIGPPAVLMGGTIPILTLGLAGSREASTRVHALIYAANTAGAFAGALCSTFFLIPSLGLDGVLHTLGIVNILAGVTFGLLELVGERVEPSYDEPASESRLEAPTLLLYSAVALLAGFAMMALQTTFNRLGGLIFGSSHFTFGIVVAVFVFCIALGSLGVSAFKTIPRFVIVGSQWLLVFLLVVLYQAIENSAYWAHVLRTLFQPVDAAFYPFQIVVFLSIFTVLIAPIALSGALLPLLFHRLRGDSGELGSVAGRLYSWNTVGSLLGALLGGYVLLFWLDLDDVYRIAVAALAVGAALLTALVYPRIRFPASILLLSIALALFMLPDWAPEKLARGLYRTRIPMSRTYAGPHAFFERELEHPFIWHSDGPIASISVREGPPVRGALNREIVNNGKSDGNLIRDYPTMSLAALVPALLAERNERCFVIGYGTGVTAGELAALESVRSVEVAEISHGVIEAAPLFEEGNLHALKSGKVTLKRSDAYRALMRSSGRFDVIVSEPSNPWVTGVEMLYSVEFLEAARDRLAKGGVYAQWFHTYEMDRETIELVMRTYASVFDHVAVWYAEGPDLLLMGFESQERVLDVNALERRFGRGDFQAGFARSGVTDFIALLAHEIMPLGTLHQADLEGAVHTLRQPILSHRAARAFFLGETAAVPRFADPATAKLGFQNSLLRRHSGRERRALTERVLGSAARETCRRRRAAECATLLAKWRRTHPASEQLSELLTELRTEWPETKEIENSNLGGLSRLFGPGQLRKLDDQSALARALQISTMFADYYHYAIPFDRRILKTAWRLCPSTDCDRAREEIEPWLGNLGRRDDTSEQRPRRHQGRVDAKPEPETEAMRK